MTVLIMKMAAIGDHAGGLHCEFSNLTLPDVCLGDFLRSEVFVV
jgi:hypothetical protein